MRRRSVATFALLAVLPAACGSSSGGSGDIQLTAATLGPEGGELGVTEGRYAGLRLTVPAGALTQRVHIRMLQPAPPPPGAASPAVVDAPGPYVRIEPKAADFATPAQLRLPYRVPAVTVTGPGNVRAMHLSATGLDYLEPPVVDVEAGRIELPIGSLGGFQVVYGLRAAAMADYLPALGTTAPLEDGWSFACTGDPLPNLPPLGLARWTLAGGGGERALYVDPSVWLVVGRADVAAGWQEVWAQGLPFLLHEANTLTPPQPATTQVFTPIGSTTVAHVGTVTLLGRFGFDVPLHIGSREFRDVLRVRLLTTWNRPDLGPGSSEQVFWFAPGVGLLQAQQDGVIRIRTDL